jgi:hypothetical protein
MKPSLSGERVKMRVRGLSFWSQFYKTNFGIIKPFFGLILANFLSTNFGQEITP